MPTGQLHEQFCRGLVKRGFRGSVLRRFALLLPLALLILSGGCVRNVQRQLTPNPVRPLGPKSYSLSFIEFDDQGELWQRCTNWQQSSCQLADTIKQIRAQGKRELLVLTYIHGWMSNASPTGGDRNKFEAVLQRLANDPEQTRPVVGIFIAWRGAVTRSPVLKEFSIWNRKNTAQHIAGPSLTEALLMIMHVTKDANANSTSIFVGHSLGGYMLEHALTQAMIDQILHAEMSHHDRKAKDAAGSELIHPLFDLVVYVNSAAGAIEAKQFIEIMKRSNVQVARSGSSDAAKGGAPLVVAVTSETDRSTRMMFPVMQGATDLDESFRKYGEPGATMPSQRSLYNHTAGHTRFLWSHQVVKEACPRSTPQSGNAMVELALGGKTYCVKPIENAWNTTPYWIFRVPKEIVNGHTDIWNPSFEALLRQILSDNDMLNGGRETKLQVK
jgi:hypothetical protein